MHTSLQKLSEARISLTWLALLNAIAFLCGYAHLYVLFWIALIGALSLSLFRIYCFSKGRTASVLVTLSASMVYLIDSRTMMTGDVSAFEIPKYFDLINATKGPFWTYALLPPILNGSALSMGIYGAAIVYVYTLVLFALSLIELLQVVNPNRVYIVSLLWVVGLSTLFNALFHIGKGDLVSAAFLNFVSAAIAGVSLLHRSSTSESSVALAFSTPSTAMFLGFLYSALSFLSKTGTVLVFIPLLFLGVACLVRNQHFSSFRFASNSLQGLLLFASTALVSMSVFVYFHQFVLHGPLTAVDVNLAQYGSRYSLANAPAHFFSSLLAFGNSPWTKPAVKTWASLIVAASCIIVVTSFFLRTLLSTSKSMSIKYKLTYLLLAMIASSLLMPFAALHPIGTGAFLATENLRLVAQPSLIIALISCL